MHHQPRRRRVSVGGCLALGLLLLPGCTGEEPRAEVMGTVLDDAGNAVKPARVAISVDGAPSEECSSDFGQFRCSSTPDTPYTLTLERGDEIYTDSVSRQGGCGDVCMTFRPFTVSTAPDGACSPDTLPLVARLVSPNPGTPGALEKVWMNRQADIAQTVLPADAVGDLTWAGTPDAYVQQIFAEPGLPSTEPLSVKVTVRANISWCPKGSWFPDRRLNGRALLPFLPKPGSSACSYDPVELGVGPGDIIACYELPY
jgi:hypothetical protein